MTAFDAVILTGGGGERLGGVDKASITIDGTTLLDRAVAAVGAADTIVCVGPERTTEDSGTRVVWTRERPSGGGPVAALNAGLEHVHSEIVVVVAVDLPFVTERVLSRLVEACVRGDADATLAEDSECVPQPLLAAYRVEALRASLRSLDSPSGASMKALLAGISYETVAEPEAAMDLDTPEDLARARRKVGAD